jgi:hypothetical protein
VNFTVTWVPAALAQLAALWNAAADQRAVTAASHRIDQQLERDPEDAGEERPPSRRILFDPPLGVVFEVDRAKAEVRVLSVGWSGRPG